MNPIGPTTQATPRFEPPAARAVEVRAPEQAQPPVAAPEASTQAVKPAQHVSRVMNESKDVAAHVAVDAQAMRESIQEAVDRLNEQMASNQRALGFKVDDETVVVLVTNKETGEIVRQIPTEAAIRMSQSFEALKGLLYDETL